MIGRRARRRDADPGPAAHRRSGPVGEARWWVPADQAWAESALLEDRDLGRGWRSIPMVNNVERLDPFGTGPACDEVRLAREARGLTALDEGQAWRRRNDAVLAVTRIEVFAERDDHDHRAVWRRSGPDCLDDTWRERWRDREVTPGWIEARWAGDDDRPATIEAAVADAIDWLVVEDHTGEDVHVYQYVTVWCGRLVATLTVRHRLGVDLGPAVLAGVTALRERASSSDPSA